MPAHRGLHGNPACRRGELKAQALTGNRDRWQRICGGIFEREPRHLQAQAIVRAFVRIARTRLCAKSVENLILDVFFSVVDHDSDLYITGVKSRVCVRNTHHTPIAYHTHRELDRVTERARQSKTKRCVRVVTDRGVNIW